jgi:hypothetical protein
MTESRALGERNTISILKKTGKLFLTLIALTRTKLLARYSFIGAISFKSHDAEAIWRR